MVVRGDPRARPAARSPDAQFESAHTLTDRAAAAHRRSRNPAPGRTRRAGSAVAGRCGVVRRRAARLAGQSLGDRLTGITPPAGSGSTAAFSFDSAGRFATRSTGSGTDLLPFAPRGGERTRFEGYFAPCSHVERDPGSAHHDFGVVRAGLIAEMRGVVLADVRHIPARPHPRGVRRNAWGPRHASEPGVLDPSTGKCPRDGSVPGVCVCLRPGIFRARGRAGNGLSGIGRLPWESR